MLNWLLGLDFKNPFKKLGRVSQKMIGEKVRKRKKTIFQECVANFKSLPESQPMWTSVHFCGCFDFTTSLKNQYKFLIM